MLKALDTKAGLLLLITFLPTSDAAVTTDNKVYAVYNLLNHCNIRSLIKFICNAPS